jgi:hypothetical protein
METLKISVLGLIPFSIYDGDYYRLISKLQIYAYLKCLLAKIKKKLNQDELQDITDEFLDICSNT